jgi:hypothetical protein
MEWTMMTAQQKRLQVLADSRAWGPFTHEEEEFLNRIWRKRKTKPSDLRPPDFTPYLRVLQPGETLENIQTRIMPGE